MKSFKVIIAHPGEQHARQAVIALQQKNFLLKYITSFYYKKIYFINFFPSFIKNWVEIRLTKRRNSLINDTLAEGIMPFFEIFKVLIQQSFIASFFSNKILKLRNDRFDKKISNIIINTKPKAVIVYNSASLQSLNACKKISSLGILDQTIGHICSWSKIIHDELSLHPNLFENSSFSIPSTRDLHEAINEVKIADIILAGSSYTQRTLKDIGVNEKKIKVIPYGVDLNRFCPKKFNEKNKRGKFKILFVGIIGLRKGIHYLLEAIKQLNHPNIELNLVGNIPPNEKWIFQYNNYFIHTKFMSHNDLAKRMMDSHIFVYPSLHEGYAIAQLEALASGLPVIGTTNSGIEDALKYDEVGYCLPIRDVDKLKEKILHLYDNREIVDIMSFKAIQVAKKYYSWENYHKNLLNFFQEYDYK